MIALDLHVHTNASFDSFANLPRLAQRAREIGLTGLAITDHNSVAAFAEIDVLASLYGLFLIKGIEIRTELGELLCLFLQEPIQVNNFEDVVTATHKQGGIVILPHPAKLRPEYLKQIGGFVDTVEVVNGRCTLEENLFAMRLARNWGLPGVGGSDAHFVADLGSVQTIIPTDSPDLEQIKEMLLEGRAQVQGMITGSKGFLRSQLIKCYKTRRAKGLLGLAKNQLRRVFFE